MSRIPATMIHKSRRTEEELRQQSQQFRIEHAIKGDYKPRNTPRMQELINCIYEHFDLATNRDKNIKRLPATDFQYLREDYSPPTLIKAKRILGIKSVRREGYWFWTYPKENPTTALESVHKRKLEAMDLASKELQTIQRAASVTLQEIMIASNLYCSNVDALREMMNRGYSYNTTIKMKSHLGIRTKKIDNEWMWIWGNRTVQDWLEGYLSAGPQPLQSIYDDAFAEHNWCKEVVLAAKEALGNINYRFLNKISYWMDINSPGNMMPEVFPLTAPRMPTVEEDKRRISREPYVDDNVSLPSKSVRGVHMLGENKITPLLSNEIVVDFDSDEEEDNEETTWYE